LLFVSSVLTSLSLYYNRIGNEGARAIADALHVNSVLTSLNLAGEYGEPGIGPEGANAIADALHVNSVLTELDLRWNDLRGGEAALREIAKDRPSLTLML
jgi:hypothetical protein